MKEKVLITGGTGLLGTALCEWLEKSGYEVALLSRRASKGKYRTFLWDIDRQIIEPEAIEFADHIIHLAGASVFDKKWTPAYKQEMIDSRVKSANVLYNVLGGDHHVKTFISASGIAYYGPDTGDKIVDENSPIGEGFLAELTKSWEAAALQMQPLGIRTAMIRIGIVLSDKGGALPQMLWPVKWGIGSPLGSGKQLVPWIHIDDLCRMFIHLLQNTSASGVYNGVAPNPVSNKTLTKSIASLLKRPFWNIGVPAFVMKIVVGKEFAMSVLGGNNVSSEKVRKTGFSYLFQDHVSALKDLIKHS